MRIATLEPFITDTVLSLLGKHALVAAVPGTVPLPEGTVALDQPPTTPRRLKSTLLETSLSESRPALDPLVAAAPELILTSVVATEEQLSAMVSELELALEPFLSGVRICSFAPRTIEGVYSFFTDLGGTLGDAPAGRALAQRCKAQWMDWCDNFYPRMKGKRVSFISGVRPLTLAGGWIPELVQLCSAHPQGAGFGQPDLNVSWEQIVEYRPDVIVVAPRGVELLGAIRLFEEFERRKGWEQIPAVKRGEVVFCGGDSLFYSPSPVLIDSMAVLVSALAGFESGYITPRESFYRLRWLELHRHKLRG